MLSKINRLLKDKDFKKVFQLGDSHYANNIGVKSVKNEFKQNRFGIIISSKISKKATERSKLKRQIREIIKTLLGRIKLGYDVIIIVTSPAILGKRYKEIECLMLKNFKKLNLLK